jgi:hypothetical protein
MYNVTLWRVRATIVADESSMYYIFWVCVCSFGYPACNAHAPSVACPALQYFSTLSHIVICCLSGSTVFFHIIPYCHQWPVRLYSNFPHYPILSSVACPALQYFSTLSDTVISGLSGSTIFSTVSHKRHDFREKYIIEHEMCVLIFSKNFVWNISHSKKKWERYDQKCVLAV